MGGVSMTIKDLENIYKNPIYAGASFGTPYMR